MADGITRKKALAAFSAFTKTSSSNRNNTKHLDTRRYPLTSEEKLLFGNSFLQIFYIPHGFLELPMFEIPKLIFT